MLIPRLFASLDINSLAFLLCLEGGDFYRHIFTNLLRLIITNLISNILGNFPRYSGAFCLWNVLAFRARPIIGFAD